MFINKMSDKYNGKTVIDRVFCVFIWKY